MKLSQHQQDQQQPGLGGGPGSQDQPYRTITPGGISITQKIQNQALEQIKRIAKLQGRTSYHQTSIFGGSHAKLLVGRDDSSGPRDFDGSPKHTMSVRMTDSNERKQTGGGSPNSRASDNGFASKSSNGLRKALNNTESGSGNQSSNKGGNNVPWGKVNDRTKMSSKMFQMTAKVESTKFYTQEKQMLNKDITAQIIREQANRRNRNSFNMNTSPQKRATLQNLYQIQENANLELQEVSPPRSERKLTSDDPAIDLNLSRSPRSPSKPVRQPSHQQDKIAESDMPKAPESKADLIKSRLKQLFLNYCDFQVDTGEIFITQLNFIKVLKDAGVFDQTLSSQNLSLIISKEFRAPANQIKNLTFDQYLNLILRIAEFKNPVKYKQSPKSVLLGIINENFIPLIDSIENAVENDVHSVRMHTLYSVSDASLKLIVYDYEVKAMFKDIVPLLQSIYAKYFKHEMMLTSASASKAEQLMKKSLKAIMVFLKEFELCPQYLHQRASFLIWFSVIEAKNQSELTNNSNMKRIISKTQELGNGFTLSHFITFLYRFSIIHFNYVNEAPENFNSTKKVLSMLQQLEISDSFRHFLKKLHRTYSAQYSFLPSKRLLVDIIRNEGKEINIDYSTSVKSASLSPSITKEELIAMILNDYQPVKNEDASPGGLSRSISKISKGGANESFVFDEQPLLKVFERYCQFGEPMNTKLLKSSKFVRLLRECGLVKDISELPVTLQGKALQVTITDIDIAFKKVCSNFERSPVRQDLNTIMNKRLSLGSTQFQQKLFTKQNDSNYNRTLKKAQESTMSRRVGFSPSKSMLSDVTLLSTLGDTGFSSNQQNKLDFKEFKRLLYILGQQMFPQMPTEEESFIAISSVLISMNFLKYKNEGEQEILKQRDMLGDQEYLEIMRLLQFSLHDTFRKYSNIKLQKMDFNQFVTFCADHDLFPSYSSKSNLFKIFHLLSSPLPQPHWSHQTSLSPARRKSPAITETLEDYVSFHTQQHSDVEFLDEAAFIQALSLLAITHNLDAPVTGVSPTRQDDEANAGALDEEEDDDFDGKVDPELSGTLGKIRKILQLVERVAQSEGVCTRRNTRPGESIKIVNILKADMMEPYKKRYPWYFRDELNLETPKPKTFQDILGSQSIISTTQNIY